MDSVGRHRHCEERRDEAIQPRPNGSWIAFPSARDDGAEIRAAPEARLWSRPALGRVLWVHVHRYIGLVLGALFVFVGLTASILAFWQAIDEWLNADIMRVEVPAQAIYRPLDEILAAAKAVAPPNGVPDGFGMPRHPGAAASVWSTVPGGWVSRLPPRITSRWPVAFAV
jgi:PepSY-associated TM region